MLRLKLQRLRLEALTLWWALILSLLLVRGAFGSEAFLTPLGDLTGADLPAGVFRSAAAAISADGSVVVGVSKSANSREAFRWTPDGGMEGLGDLPGGELGSTAMGVSADGSVIVGWGQSANSTEAFRWTADDGMLGLGNLPGGELTSIARAVSADGSVIVGSSGNRAFHWIAEAGMVKMDDLPGNHNFDFANAQSLSSNGAVVVGSTRGQVDQAFRWTRLEPVTVLGDLFDGQSESGANGVSADGSVIVGWSGSANGRQAGPVTFRSC